MQLTLWAYDSKALNTESWHVLHMQSMTQCDRQKRVQWGHFRITPLSSSLMKLVKSLLVKQVLSLRCLKHTLLCLCHCRTRRKQNRVNRFHCFSWYWFWFPLTVDSILHPKHCATIPLYSAQLDYITVNAAASQSIIMQSEQTQHAGRLNWWQQEIQREKERELWIYKCFWVRKKKR